MAHAGDLSIFGDFAIIGLFGSTLTPIDREVLSAVRPIGLLLLGRNFSDGKPYEAWLSDLKTLLEEVKALTGRDRMFFTIDHEGGRVVRPPLPITRFPYPALYGSLARSIAVASAIELRSLGMNVSWAPCTDTHSNPLNPVIGPRSFATTPEQVIPYATEYLAGLSEEGILGCGKHFPGHGDTSQDSHFELPVVDQPLDVLQRRELLPFQAFAKLQVPFMLTSHVMFPQVDSKNPATLSSKILQGILRDQFGYQGIIATDDLEMEAIAGMLKDPSTIARAFGAGCEMFIHARHPNKVSALEEDRFLQLARSFTTALENGSISREKADQARQKILRLLEKTPMYPVTPLSSATFLKHQALSVSAALGEGLR